MPHQGQPVLAAGKSLDQAHAAVIAVHGRGASAADILTVATALERPNFAYLAPQAEASAWYPYGFMAPVEQNEPWLSDALALLGRLVAQVADAGVPPERLVLLGFSQGACLALEYAARNARRYGAIAGLSGGLIGPDGIGLDHDGLLAGTPVFLGCSDVDPHIPKRRVEETRAALERQQAQVTMRLYAGMGHEVNDDELENVRRLMDAL
jgi:phospholipase/carboxylesterase/glyoxalase family protein